MEICEISVEEKCPNKRQYPFDQDGCLNSDVSLNDHLQNTTCEREDDDDLQLEGCEFLAESDMSCISTILSYDAIVEEDTHSSENGNVTLKNIEFDEYQSFRNIVESRDQEDIVQGGPSFGTASWKPENDRSILPIMICSLTSPVFSNVFFAEEEISKLHAAISTSPFQGKSNREVCDMYNRKTPRLVMNPKLSNFIRLKNLQLYSIYERENNGEEREILGANNINIGRKFISSLKKESKKRVIKEQFVFPVSYSIIRDFSFGTITTPELEYGTYLKPSEEVTIEVLQMHEYQEANSSSEVPGTLFNPTHEKEKEMQNLCKILKADISRIEDTIKKGNIFIENSTREKYSKLNVDSEHFLNSATSSCHLNDELIYAVFCENYKRSKEHPDPTGGWMDFIFNPKNYKHPKKIRRMLRNAPRSVYLSEKSEGNDSGWKEFADRSEDDDSECKTFSGKSEENIKYKCYTNKFEEDTESEYYANESAEDGVKIDSTEKSEEDESESENSNNRSKKYFSKYKLFTNRPEKHCINKIFTKDKMLNGKLKPKFGYKPKINATFDKNVESVGRRKAELSCKSKENCMNPPFNGSICLRKKPDKECEPTNAKGSVMSIKKNLVLNKNATSEGKLCNPYSEISRNTNPHLKTCAKGSKRETVSYIRCKILKTTEFDSRNTKCVINPQKREQKLKKIISACGTYNSVLNDIMFRPKAGNDFSETESYFGDLLFVDAVPDNLSDCPQSCISRKDDWEPDDKKSCSDSNNICCDTKIFDDGPDEGWKLQPASAEKSISCIGPKSGMVSQEGRYAFDYWNSKYFPLRNLKNKDEDFGDCPVKCTYDGNSESKSDPNQSKLKPTWNAERDELKPNVNDALQFNESPHSTCDNGKGNVSTRYIKKIGKNIDPKLILGEGEDCVKVVSYKNASHNLTNSVKILQNYDPQLSDMYDIDLENTGGIRRETVLLDNNIQPNPCIFNVLSDLKKTIEANENSRSKWDGLFMEQDSSDIISQEKEIANYTSFGNYQRNVTPSFGDQTLLNYPGLEESNPSLLPLGECTSENLEMVSISDLSWDPYLSSSVGDNSCYFRPRKLKAAISDPKNVFGGFEEEFAISSARSAYASESVSKLNRGRKDILSDGKETISLNDIDGNSYSAEEKSSAFVSYEIEEDPVLYSNFAGDPLMDEIFDGVSLLDIGNWIVNESIPETIQSDDILPIIISNVRGGIDVEGGKQTWESDTINPRGNKIKVALGNNNTLSTNSHSSDRNSNVSKEKTRLTYERSVTFGCNFNFEAQGEERKTQPDCVTCEVISRSKQNGSRSEEKVSLISEPKGNSENAEFLQMVLEKQKTQLASTPVVRLRRLSKFLLARHNYGIECDISKKVAKSKFKDRSINSCMKKKNIPNTKYINKSKNMINNCRNESSRTITDGKTTQQTNSKFQREKSNAADNESHISCKKKIKLKASRKPKLKHLENQNRCRTKYVAENSKAPKKARKDATDYFLDKRYVPCAAADGANITGPPSRVTLASRDSVTGTTGGHNSVSSSAANRAKKRDAKSHSLPSSKVGRKRKIPSSLCKNTIPMEEVFPSPRRPTKKRKMSSAKENKVEEKSHAFPSSKAVDKKPCNSAVRKNKENFPPDDDIVVVYEGPRISCFPPFTRVKEEPQPSCSGLNVAGIKREVAFDSTEDDTVAPPYKRKKSTVSRREKASSKAASSNNKIPTFGGRKPKRANKKMKKSRSLPLTKVDKITLDALDNAVSPLCKGKQQKGHASSLDGEIKLITAHRNRKNTLPGDRMTNNTLFLPFKKGWKREVVHRKNRSTADIYYFSPTIKKLRSMREVSNYLDAHYDPDLSLANFTYMKTPIFNMPFEYVRFALGKSVISGMASKIKKEPQD